MKQLIIMLHIREDMNFDERKQITDLPSEVLQKSVFVYLTCKDVRSLAMVESRRLKHISEDYLKRTCDMFCKFKIINYRHNLPYYFQPPIRSRSTPWWASRDPTHSGLLLVKLFDEGYSHDETRYAFLPTIGKRTKININSSADVQELINPLSSFLFPFFSVSFWATTL